MLPQGMTQKPQAGAAATTAGDEQAPEVPIIRHFDLGKDRQALSRNPTFNAGGHSHLWGGRRHSLDFKRWHHTTMVTSNRPLFLICGLRAFQSIFANALIAPTELQKQSLPFQR